LFGILRSFRQTSRGVGVALSIVLVGVKGTRGAIDHLPRWERGSRVVAERGSEGRFSGRARLRPGPGCF
jgi:hypothetical protein